MTTTADAASASNISSEELYRAAATNLSVARILRDRHETADLEWDVTAWICKRLKEWADPNCFTCRGEGRTGLKMEPRFVENPLAIHKRIRVDDVPVAIPCKCTNHIAKDRNRLHRENASASQIGLETLKVSAAVAQELERLRSQELQAIFVEIVEIKRTSIGYKLRNAWRWLRRKIRGGTGRPTSSASPAADPAVQASPAAPADPSPTEGREP